MTPYHDPIRRVFSLVGRTRRRLVSTVSGIAFWTAIVVPVAYLLVMVRGVDTRSQFTTFVALIALNYVALILGHSHYERSDR